MIDPIYVDKLTVMNQQLLYDLLIAAKNEWNKRAADFDTYPNLKKVYLHFENSLASTHKTKIK